MITPFHIEYFANNNLENFRKDDETWKIRIIEPEFKERMFEEK